MVGGPCARAASPHAVPVVKVVDLVPVSRPLDSPLSKQLIHHGQLPETLHLAVGDSHLHLRLLRPVFRGCQGPQNHPQGTCHHTWQLAYRQLLT